MGKHFSIELGKTIKVMKCVTLVILAQLSYTSQSLLQA